MILEADEDNTIYIHGKLYNLNTGGQIVEDDYSFRDENGVMHRSYKEYTKNQEQIKYNLKMALLMISWISMFEKKNYFVKLHQHAYFKSDFELIVKDKNKCYHYIIISPNENNVFTVATRLEEVYFYPANILIAHALEVIK